MPNSDLDPNGLEGIPINIASHSIEMSLKARVILGTDLKPETIFLENQNVSMKFPGFAYPFIKNGALVMCICSMVQVTKVEPLAASGKLLIPGSH